MTYEKHFANGKIVQTARIIYLSIGKYAFETQLPNKKPEININMPWFNTEKEAHDWICSAEKWKPIMKEEIQ